MSRVRLALAIAVLSPATMLGCSFLFDFTGYEGGDASALDAPIDRAGDIVLDGASGDVADAVVITDSGDAAPKPFCASQAAVDADFYLCADFDQPDTGLSGPQGFGCVYCDAGLVSGAVLPDDDSLPNALVVTVPPMSGSSSAIIEYRTSTTSAFIQHVYTGFDFKADTLASGFVSIYSVGDVIVFLSLATSEVRESNYVDGAAATYPFDAGSLDVTKWHRYTFDYAPSTRTLVMTIDGKTAAQAASIAGGSGVQFRTGLDFIGGPAGVRHLHYDNVVYATFR